MSVLLPARLPDGYTIEPATSAHVQEMFAISSAELIDVFGFNTETVEDVRCFVEHPAETKTVVMLVRDDKADLVQWWVAFNDPGDPIFYAWTPSDPRLPADLNDELATAGWTMLVAWIRGNAPGGAGTIEVQSLCPAGSVPRQRQLRAAGFDHRRTFWR